jgi:uncharacterized protein (DUF2267 family)
MAEQLELGLMEEESFSGEGVGTSYGSFMAVLRERVPELPMEACADAVMTALCERLSGGLVQRLLAQLPGSLRELFGHCAKSSQADARRFDAEDFYLEVAEQLDLEPTRVRRVLHGVFGALHSQITEGLSDRIVAELPDTLKSTWLAARHRVPAPH